ENVIEDVNFHVPRSFAVDAEKLENFSALFPGVATDKTPERWPSHTQFRAPGAAELALAPSWATAPFRLNIALSFDIEFSEITGRQIPAERI
ncbi:MAG: hypothetical protein O7C61_07355, partial [SAR324 cluster bacterium]|nr:hypothetical protein [SAR324 cluster bacterium]